LAQTVCYRNGIASGPTGLDFSGNGLIAGTGWIDRRCRQPITGDPTARASGARRVGGVEIHNL